MDLIDAAVQPDTGISPASLRPANPDALLASVPGATGSGALLRAFGAQLAAQGYAEFRTPAAAVAPETEERRRR